VGITKFYYKKKLATATEEKYRETVTRKCKLIKSAIMYQLY
jgi:hypothetical protein